MGDDKSIYINGNNFGAVISGDNNVIKTPLLQQLNILIYNDSNQLNIIKSLLFQEDIHNCLVDRNEFNNFILKISNLDKKYRNKTEEEFVSILIDGNLQKALFFFYNNIWDYIYNQEALYIEGIYFLNKIKIRKDFSNLDKQNKALTLNLIALCQSRSGNFLGAIKNLKQVLILFSSTNNNFGKLSASRDLIDDLIWVGELKEAEKLIIEMIALALKLDKLEIVAKYQRQYGRLLIDKSEFNKSEVELQKSLDYFQGINDFQNIKVGYIYFASLEIERKSFQNALNYLEKSEEINFKNNDLRDDLRINILYSKLFLEKNDIEKSQYYLNKINVSAIKQIDYYTDYLIQKGKVNFFLNNKCDKDIQSAITQSYISSNKIKLVDIWLFNKYKNLDYSYEILSLSTLNTIFLLEQDKKYIIKLFTDIESGFFKGKERNRNERVKKEQSVLTYLQDKDIDVPKIIDYDLNYGVIIREYLNSEPLNEIYTKISMNDKYQILEKIGIWVGKFHQELPKDIEIIVNSNLFTLKNLEVVLNSYIKNKKFDFLYKYILLIKEKFIFEENEKIFLWGSCSIDNIYYDKVKGNIVGNDFEFSFLGDRYYDLGRMIMSIVRLEEDDKYLDNLVDSFILGYKNIDNKDINKQKIYLWAIISTLINIEWNNIKEDDAIILINRIKVLI